MTEPVGANSDATVTDRSSEPLTILGDNAALLDEPLGGQFDQLAALYVLMATDARNDGAATMRDIEAANEERAAAWEEHLEALREAQEAQEDEGFWSDFTDTFSSVATIAGVVGSVALAVASGGAATPVVCLALGGAVLSGASMAQSEFHYLEQMGISEEAAGWIGTGMGVLGGLASITAGGYSLLAGGATAASGLGHTLGQGAVIVSGASSIAAGSGRLVLAHDQSEAAHHEADAAQALLDAQMLQLFLSQLIDQFEDDQERETNNVRRITSMNELHASSLTLAAGGAV